MSYYSIELSAQTFWANFAGMHILYQVAIIAIATFLIVMSLTFVYNMVALAFTYTKDVLKMIYEFLEKGVRQLSQAIEKLFARNSESVQA
ncbi:hypothetical protein NEF87_003329 [Candidatus Lokiarchaeum ossiferum]|uniref:Uncharacterized protein n=1 Tax=Candidatus Lokiarchaeum ossiferum TaxID=2951803 RepID=A0ABY6HWV3_9ARCH|nr:hypothetical protein NEF87_003329 [Candidatus Lokiarchaeum sp. B-35]